MRPRLSADGLVLGILSIMVFNFFRYFKSAAKCGIIRPVLVCFWYLFQLIRKSYNYECTCSINYSLNFWLACWYWAPRAKTLMDLVETPKTLQESRGRSGWLRPVL